MRTACWTTGLSLLALSAGFAQAAEPPAYLDDRSDAAAIVKSFYNAVSRREYARAWDYFGDQKPSATFAAFVKGYENTDLVQIVTGEPGVEGAAGSTFFSLPVALLATNADSSQQVFAGCYTARLGNPQAPGAAVPGPDNRARRVEAFRAAVRGEAAGKMRRRPGT